MPLSNKYGIYFEEFDTKSTFEFYESVRSTLPQANFPKASKRVCGLLDIADDLDVFVFDAYGVLNVGSTPIDGARECISALRDKGKRIFVLTNSATFPAARNEAKFANLRFDFDSNEIISSRMGAQNWIAKQDVKLWGVMGHLESAPQDFDASTVMLGDDPAVYDEVDGFLLLSTWDWNETRQHLLDKALGKKMRPVVVANPDVIAPLEERFSTEPGFVAHRISARFNIDITFHGKPFPSVFELVEQRLAPTQEPQRIAMIGDTLHTDILGGASRGWSTVLVRNHGLFRGHDVEPFIEASGIVPTYSVPSI